MSMNSNKWKVMEDFTYQRLSWSKLLHKTSCSTSWVIICWGCRWLKTMETLFPAPNQPTQNSCSRERKCRDKILSRKEKCKHWCCCIIVLCSLWAQKCDRSTMLNWWSTPLIISWPLRFILWPLGRSRPPWIIYKCEWTWLKKEAFFETENFFIDLRL